MSKICSVDGCNKPVRYNGMCNTHLLRFKRYGNTEPHIRIRDNFGKNHPKEYRIWKLMNRRCNNPHDRAYKNYGGRGIKVCKRWSGPYGFRHFYEDMGDRPVERSLDRIDVNGNYCPENCRWSDKFTQAINKRIERKYSHHPGITYDKNKNRWVAQISPSRKHYAYYFLTEQEAIDKRRELERKYIH